MLLQVFTVPERIFIGGDFKVAIGA